MTSTHASSSQVQREAEAEIRQMLPRELGHKGVFNKEPVTLSTGTTVEVDAVCADGPVYVEIFARQGKLKAGQQKKVAMDALKLITIQRDRMDQGHAEARLVIAFSDDAAADYATGAGWLASALRLWDVGVAVVDIPHELRTKIQKAQSAQRMVNAEDVADDVAVSQNEGETEGP